MQKSYNDLSYSFLIASPSLSAPIFEESVVLVLEDGSDGSFGLIINKPQGITLGGISEDFKSDYLSNVEVFDGGPMNRERVTLALWKEDDFSGGNFSFGITPKKIESVLKDNPDAKICAFIGCSTWAAGQLQSEIAEGTWNVSHLDISTIFGLEPDEIWREMLLRQSPDYNCLPEPLSGECLN